MKPSICVDVFQKEASFTMTLKAAAKYHGVLIGRGGVKIREFMDKTGTRILFPHPDDADQDKITIIGKKDDVEKARKELEEHVASLVS